MTAEAAPDEPDWLREAVRRSPLLPERALRWHWERVIPFLPTAERYALAAILLEVEHACQM